MKTLMLVPALLLAACSSSDPAPAPPPSTLVSVIAPHQGSLPTTVVAYGSAGPALGGTQTLSEAQPGK